MCSVLPAATAIKVKSRDQADRRATIKGSRWRSGHKYDQNQNKMPDVVYTIHTLLTLMLHRAIVVISTVLCPVARILWLSTSINNDKMLALYDDSTQTYEGVLMRCK